MILQGEAVQVVLVGERQGRGDQAADIDLGALLPLMPDSYKYAPLLTYPPVREDLAGRMDYVGINYYFSIQVKEKMFLVGFMLLMALMVTVIYNDLTRVEWIEKFMFWRQ